MGIRLQVRDVLEKGSAGTGYWFRNTIEILLLGTVGHPVPPAAGEQPDQWQPGQWFEADKGEHSEKPEIAYEIIEALYPNTPRIELRAWHADWDMWGFQVQEAAE
jgi:N6-adenosine-specific RNA methylase IME4